MTAYYNEIDPFAASWLRELIKAGLIAPGEVDERSIEDVRPDELSGYKQCHFFAGIGVWSRALRMAGWPDNRPVWTGSCPCQPFSAAGKGLGFDDERHLWPSWHWLINQCRPPVVFGEQVASRDAEPWLDLVQDDMEAMGYAVGAVPFPAAGVGAPHIRDRLYWVADSNGAGLGARSERCEALGYRQATGADRGFGGVGHASSAGQQKCISLSGISVQTSGANERKASQRAGIYVGGLAYANGEQRDRAGRLRKGWRIKHSDGGTTSGPRPTNGIWQAADWLFCRDGKWRPVEPGTFPLVDGAAARVGRLRGYGNAINAEAAKAFIEIVMASTFK